MEVVVVVVVRVVASRPVMQYGRPRPSCARSPWRMVVVVVVGVAADIVTMVLVLAD